MKSLKLLLLVLLLPLFGLAQNTSVKVNPNGTHTVIHHNEKTSTQVNPDGTHTVIHHNGKTSTQVNPNGTHTVIHHNGKTSTQINPDGSHTVIQNPKRNPEKKKLTRKEKRKLRKLKK